MLIDLEKDGVQKITSSVCVVGAGAAGISMALQFESMGIKTTVLEGGGLTYPKPGTHDLYDGELADKYYPLAASRLRYLGGSTNHWGGWSRQLDDFDFMSKPYFDVSGWPIKKSELQPYYQKAAEICEINNFKASHDGTLKQQVNDGVLSWQDDLFENKFFVFSPPTRFGQKYLGDLKAANHVTTFLNANATELILEKNKVIGVHAQTLSGDQISVQAQVVIVAMGGLENARFLLNQRNEHNQFGVGNQNDLVGRYFMDHPGFRPIDLMLPTGMNYRRHAFKGLPVMPVISMTEDALLEHQLNNFCILLNQKKDDANLPSNYGQNPWLKGSEKYGTYQAQFIFEPSPCRDSRVMLSQKKDQLGWPKLKLDWRFNDRDFRSVERVIELLTQSLGQYHQGRVNWHKQFTLEHIAEIGGGMHHGGTTLMSAEESQGVVDSNCAVYGCQGLYVAGNSVFPNIGFSNPTVTIIALALRLCDHLQEQLV